MRARLVLILSLLVVLCSAGGAPAGAEPARPLAVVVARGSKVTSIDRSDLRRAFAGTVVTAGGHRLVPFNYAPGTPERTVFDRVVLGMSPEQVGRYWIDRKVRGESPAPRALPSAIHIAKVVARFPGAIGYLPLDRVGPELQVVAIDGVRPGEPGYPLVLTSP